MRWTFGKKFSSIGIDLGARTIKAAQLVQSGGSPRQLHAAVVLPLPVPNHPLDQHTAKYLRDVLFRHGFSGDDVVLAAPTKQLELDVLELPPRSSGAPIEQIARMEIARAAKLESDPFEVECWDLPASARGTSAGTSMMAVALRHKDADALIEPFEAEGFNIVAVDARCWALARSSAAYHRADSITAILDIGWNQGLVVLACNGIVIYQRTFETAGVGSLFNQIGEEFQFGEEEIDYLLRNVGLGGKSGADEEQLFEQSRRVEQIAARHIETINEEIQAAFQYASHRYPTSTINQLLLAGGGSQISGICGWLQQRLAVNVMTLTPAQIVQCPKNLDARGSDSMLTVAVGLAMHGEH